MLFRLAFPATQRPLTSEDDSTRTAQQASVVQERNRRLGAERQGYRRVSDDSAGGQAGKAEGLAVSVTTAASGASASVDGAATATVTLSNGVKMPRLGFGTAGLGEGTQQAVLWALEVGYRWVKRRRCEMEVNGVDARRRCEMEVNGVEARRRCEGRHGTGAVGRCSTRMPACLPACPARVATQPDSQMQDVHHPKKKVGVAVIPVALHLTQAYTVYDIPPG